MRKQNSEFLTTFTSEATNDIKNTDYFAFVELDDFACYVIADGIDDQVDAMSAKLAVAAVISTFSEAPSMSKRAMKRCLNTANKVLLEAKSKTKLKASVMIVVTNYVTLRYGQAGNIRLRLYRNGFIKNRTMDQSLTMDMVNEEKISQDKVAAHEERNNLYAYLGQKKEFHPFISKKIKLTNEDALVLYTRGVWEHVDEGELQDVFAEATDDPKKTIDDIEDLLMSRQPKDLRKYTMAVIFINKIFTDPNRKRKIKRIILAVVSVLFVTAVIAVLLIIMYQRKQDKIENMESGYMETIEYIQMNNYVRAQECCNKTLDLAEELKDKRTKEDLGSYMKLIEAVLAGQEDLDSGDYAEAQKGFQEAEIRARYADNLGMDYIDEKLALTADCISVYDLVTLGDVLVLNLQYEKAEEYYLQAKALASKNYFDKGRTAAMDALEALYETQKEEAAAANEELGIQLAAEESAANYLSKGDMAYTQGDYESAKVYYNTALLKYQNLEDEIQQGVVSDKLLTVEGKLSDKAGKMAEAEEYVEQALSYADEGDYTSAKKYYLLAKDVYANLKDEDKLAEIARKMEALDVKQEAQEVASQKMASQEAEAQATVQEVVVEQEMQPLAVQ